MLSFYNCPFPADTFGRLTDGGLKFKELSPNNFLFDSLTLVCGSDGSPIYRTYRQYNTDKRDTELATFEDTQLGLSWLTINKSKQGYYGCVIDEMYSKEIGVFDLSLTTGKFSFKFLHAIVYLYNFASVSPPVYT